MENNSVEKWQEFSNKVSIEDLISNINNLPRFQIELSKIINSFYVKGKSILEVGCEFGLTSFILNDGFSKNLLDFDDIALNKSKVLFDKFNKNAKFYHQDMFNMNFDNKFDIIFNAGVLEHFNHSDRVKLLKKYSEFLNEKGKMIIAIPNHYNFLYRSAYFILNFIGKWSFPHENKIHDMQKEIFEAGLVLEKRLTVDKENVYKIWGRFGPLLKLLYGPFMKEGYLTILIIKKI